MDQDIGFFHMTSEEILEFFDSLQSAPLQIEAPEPTPEPAIDPFTLDRKEFQLHLEDCAPADRVRLKRKRRQFQCRMAARRHRQKKENLASQIESLAIKYIPDVASLIMFLTEARKLF